MRLQREVATDHRDRLAGARVLVAQGDADQVIPRELLAARGDTSATNRSRPPPMLRSPGGHALTQDVVTALHDWVADTLSG